MKVGKDRASDEESNAEKVKTIGQAKAEFLLDTQNEIEIAP